MGLDKQQFLNLCSQANTKVDLAQRRFSAWLSSIAIPYGEAWQRHTNVLKSIATQMKNEENMALAAGLAFIPGGIGGVIGGTMKKIEAGDFLIDGVKDISKWGMRSGAVVGVENLGTVTDGSKPHFSDFPADPLRWQNEINMRVQTEMAAVTQRIERWQNSVNTGDPQFEPNFSPLDQIDTALQLQPPNTAPMEAELIEKVNCVKEYARSADTSPSYSYRGAYAGFEWPQTQPVKQAKIKLSDLQPEDQRSLQLAFEKGFLFMWTLNHYYSVRISAWGFSTWASTLDSYAQTLGWRYFRGFASACDVLHYRRPTRIL